MADKPSLSIRKHIRRGHEPAHENTSTLVLTSAEKNFVDVRVLNSNLGSKVALPNDPNNPSAFKRLEWAFAGRSHSTEAEFENGKLTKPAHTVWTHWVDSTTLDPVRDEGDMYEQENGDVLEKGIDTDPQTGLPREYEELWKDVEPTITGTDNKHLSYVLKLDNGTTGARGMLIRIGSHIQGLKRLGDDFTVVRWEWTLHDDNLKSGAWERTLAIGNGTIPCELLFSGLKGTRIDLAVGSTVLDSTGDGWTCLEAFSW